MPGTSNETNYSQILMVFICMSLNNDLIFEEIERYPTESPGIVGKSGCVLTKCRPLQGSLSESFAEINTVAGVDVIVTSKYERGWLFTG